MFAEKRLAVAKVGMRQANVAHMRSGGVNIDTVQNKTDFSLSKRSRSDLSLFT